MQTSLNIPSQKIQNILVRYNCSKDMLSIRADKDPENFHLLKYFPKYYKSLALEITKQNSLQSKIKRIKKLKKFTGYFKKNLSSNLWANLLANVRKEIEELPRITSSNSSYSPFSLFWPRLTLWKIKFFPNVTRVFLPKRKPEYIIHDRDDASHVVKSFVKYLNNSRKVKTLDIFVDVTNPKKMKWTLEKLGQMDLFLARLEKKRMDLENSNMNIQVLLKDKNLASQLTSLIFSFILPEFTQNLILVPQLCTNLKFLSIGFLGSLDEKPKFLEFLTSLGSLKNLMGLEFGFPRGAKYYWEYFKPQSSLRYLKLKLDGSDLISADLMGAKAKDTFGHWEDIEDLNELELIMQTVHILEVAHARSFFTAMLQKVRKLRSLKATIETFALGRNSPRGEPFIVEGISHLYDCLEKFEFTFKNKSGGVYPKFDMNTMKVFRNLKKFKFHGLYIDADNIEEMVDLLQTNQKKGDLPMFTFVSEYVQSLAWFRETMEKIFGAKKADKNLKIVMDLSFQTDPSASAESLLDIIKSAETIEGLFVILKLGSQSNSTDKDKFRNVVKKYGELRNLVVKMGNFWTYRRQNGEKEQFIH